ncbi:MAG: HAMP domain-containing histidine kinase [Allobaculum sp.]|nr:HAMP domain-containing histidine kinase [Allobaculum sp.]
MLEKYRIYFKALWKQNWLLIVAWLGTGISFWLLCWAFQESTDPVWVWMLLSSLVLMVYLGFSLRTIHEVDHLLLADHFKSQDYPEVLHPAIEKLAQMAQEKRESLSKAKQEASERQDYFSLWAHQIKLPLAALDLQLQLDCPDHTDLKASEKRIEHCVSQAMAYIRLDGSDYRLNQVSLEDVIRPILRENASAFIAQHISIESDFDLQPVLTDRKWIGFVIEQLLSNALKYSKPYSTIHIETKPNTLIIQDEGCGIAPEDLPRLFEKGFTGKNGHQNVSTSSGLGLYLCEKICTNLGCTLSIQNRPDQQGVIAQIQFPQTLFLKD